MADELLNQTMKCVDMVRSALDGSGENEYIEALQVADTEAGAFKGAKCRPVRTGPPGGHHALRRQKEGEGQPECTHPR